MALLGNGAMVIWHDLADGTKVDFQDWHSHEHLAERVGLPGFLRGRRCVAVSGAPTYCMVYEVDGLAVLTSPPYLARLNDPTPWSTKSLQNFRNANRTLCHTVASHGLGVGNWLLTIQLSPSDGKADSLQTWLAADRLPALATMPGLTGAHLLRGDPDASRTETAEKKLRDRPDDIADWVLLIDGYDRNAVTAVRDDHLSAATLQQHGARPGPTAALYELEHCVSDADLAAVG